MLRVQKPVVQFCAACIVMFAVGCNKQPAPLPPQPQPVVQLEWVGLQKSDDGAPVEQGTQGRQELGVGMESTLSRDGGAVRWTVVDADESQAKLVFTDSDGARHSLSIPVGENRDAWIGDKASGFRFKVTGIIEGNSAPGKTNTSN